MDIDSPPAFDVPELPEDRLPPPINDTPEFSQRAAALRENIARLRGKIARIVPPPYEPAHFEFSCFQPLENAHHVDEEAEGPGKSAGVDAGGAEARAAPQQESANGPAEHATASSA
ncbi:hypothetical protein HDU96_010663 [Phlyctochytrium bullatum]|nr:hypothetical protein HDU96_010663 [Phlyctochytrium bullatum]